MNLSEKEIIVEKERLAKTIKIIREKISVLGQEMYEKKEKIQEFQKFIWDSRTDMDPSEMKSMMSNNDLEITMALQRRKYLQKLFKIQNSPYFGSILFNTKDQIYSIYIGITHVEDEENDEYLVHDWRAPICSLFYDYEVGHAEYKAPEGMIDGEILNKRQFKITDGKLIRIFDNNLNIDDEVLQEVLAQESTDKMKNIVNTIQQEQNAIIRNIEDKNLIVQGIAGSGKTSVALHRIAFLLYKINNLNSKNVLIFSPNQVFLEYISNVLPELGEENTMQTTFHDFLNYYINEYKYVESFTSFVERYYKGDYFNKQLVQYKQSDQIVDDINSYIRDLLEKIEFLDGIDNHDISITKSELNYLLKDRFSKLLLKDRINEIANKICFSYYKGKKTKKSHIISQLNKLLNIQLDYKGIFKNFFHSKYFTSSYNGVIDELELNKVINNNKFLKYEDACIFVYIKGLLEGFDYRGLIKEIVIDEAQDYNKLQYIILKNIFKKSGFTILGDVNQTINPYYRYKSLNELQKIFGLDNSKYLELNKTYRSSEEIIDFTNKILDLKHVSAIRKSNNIPVIIKQSNNTISDLKKDILYLKEKHRSVAVITKTDDEAIKLYELLKNEIDGINVLSSVAKEFNKNLVILPSYIAKGLEFDSIIVYTEKNNKYTEDEKYLYYVACTRCQHELIVYNQE